MRSGHREGAPVTFQDLRTLLDFHYWARDRILDAVDVLTPEQFTRDLGSSFKSVRDTLAHTFGAEWVWYSRWQGTSPTGFQPFDVFTSPGELRSAWAEHETKVRSFLDSLGEEGINRRFDYRMFNGNATSSLFWQMLQHVVNHASYHRGQVTTMLRQLGAAPGKSTDLITYYRERT
jgi:uncharacterized damage-inducible protein DinB